MATYVKFSALARASLQHSLYNCAAATTETSAVLVFHATKAQDQVGKQRAGNQPAGAGRMSTNQLSEAAVTRDSSATTHDDSALMPYLAARKAADPYRLETNETFALAGELFSLYRDRARADRVGAVCTGTPGHRQSA